MAHVVTIDKEEGAIFAGLHQQVRMGAGLIRQQHRSTAPQIEVPGLILRLVGRGEVVDNGTAWAQLDDAVTDVNAPGIHVEGPIARREEDVTSGINRQTTAALPDAAPGPIRVGTENHGSLERGCVISKKLAMVWRFLPLPANSYIHPTVKYNKSLLI